MRWAVAVVLLAGCFSRPQFHGRGDGGGDDDGGGGDDGGGSGDAGLADAAMFDSPLAGCTWTRIGTLFDDASFDERHPWISHDALTLTFWRGDAPANMGDMRQAVRFPVTATWGTTSSIVMPNAGPESDPSVTHDLYNVYFLSNTGLKWGHRANENGVFGDFMSPSDMASVTGTRQVQEGFFMTDDNRRFLFVAGESSDPYHTEDLYIASRAGGTGAFGTPVEFPHNITTNKNECCPTLDGNVLMYEREASNGKTEIWSSIDTGMGWSPPEKVVIAGTNASDSFQQPSLALDATYLVYVVFTGNEWHLEHAQLDCP